MSFRQYVEDYPSYHRHPVNKALHLGGIPTIILGIILLLTSRWGWGLASLGAGSFVLWLGHKIEGNKPALVKNPIYILAAPIWYGQTIWKAVRSVGSKNKQAP